MYHKKYVPMGKNRTMGQSLKTRLCMVFLEHLKALASLPPSGNTFQVHFALQGPYLLSKTFQCKPAPGAAGGLRYVREYTTETE